MDPNPRVTVVSQPQWTHPVQVGPATLLSLARHMRTIEAVGAILERLVPDPFNEHMLRFYSQGRERFGAHWEYADQLTVLHAAATLIQPRSYLEIGVFRGRSLAVVAAAAPDAELYAFDLWVKGYAGLDNAGPELVREQLRRVGHRGACHIESGDSHATVPRLLAEQPELEFDLVTVDGDHTEAGARRDLEAVLPRVRLGGVLVFDDIRHPRHPWLERVWAETVAALPTFAAATFTEVGHGVALAVRRAAEGSVLRQMQGDTGERIAYLARALEEVDAKRDERIEILESEMSRRLEVIERQGAELGQLHGTIAALQDEIARSHGETGQLRGEIAGLQGEASQLRDEIARLRDHVEFAEADRATRLEVIERQGSELGYLRHELAQLRGHIGSQLLAAKQWIEQNMSGPWQRRRGAPLLDLVNAALAQVEATAETPAAFSDAAPRPVARPGSGTPSGAGAALEPPVGGALSGARSG